MPDLDPTLYRLNDLKLRWEQDPSSRLFLQLADEHRKLGQHPEAVVVLEQGLKHRPNDLSALVALGRCRLELELAEEAVEPLETVVSRDPTHIVASKLLIEAHLQQGDVAKASERLRIYRLLNDRDPEMAHLEYRLKRLEDEDEQESPTVATAELTGEVDEVNEPEGASEVSAPEALSMPEPEDELEIEPDESVDVVPAKSTTEVATPVVSAESSPEPEREPDTRSPSVSEKPEPAVDEEASASLQTTAESASVVDPFQLSEDVPSPDLDALWKQLPEPEPPPADPFLGLTALDAGRHWEMLSQEGIFSSPGAPAGNGRGSAAASVVELEPPANLLSVSEATEAAEPGDQAEESAIGVDPGAFETEAAESAVEDEAVELEPEVEEPESVVETEDLDLVAGALPEEELPAEPVRAEDVAAEDTAAEDTAVALDLSEPEAAVETAPAEAEADVLDAEFAGPEEVTRPAGPDDESEETPLIGALAAGAVAGAAALAGLSGSQEPASQDEPETDDIAAAEAEELAIEEPPALVAQAGEELPAADDSTPAQAEPEPAEEVATATLGELYLKQGHREEAERIFRQVLEQDSGNRIALAGLARLDPLRSKPLTAADLLAVRTAGGRIPEGLTAKKVLVLGNYSKHLRAGAQGLGGGETSPSAR